MKFLQTCLLLAAIGTVCSFSWRDVQAHGRTTAIVIVTAVCTFYTTQLQRSTPTFVEVVNINESVEPDQPADQGSALKWIRQPAPLSDASLKRIASRLEEDAALKDFNRTLDNICVERQPGTASHRTVQQFIVSEMKSLGWTVDKQTFHNETPHGLKPFTNIIATLDPHECHHLVLACHYDSKVLDNFVGAIDSAVPCSQMIHLAKVLNTELQAQKIQSTGLSPQLIFFDGEEAFDTWSKSDSLYGSRKLARTWYDTRYPHSEENRCRRNVATELDRLEVLILLDLIGAEAPSFKNFFPETKGLYDQMASIEQRLNALGLMEGNTKYFSGRTTFAAVEDDHIPFMRKDVPIVHLISTPFPAVWHGESDTKENLHRPTIRNLNKIFAVFLAWYLEL